MQEGERGERREERWSLTVTDQPGRAAAERRGKHLERRKQGWPRAFVAPLNGLIGPLGGPLVPLGQPGGI